MSVLTKPCPKCKGAGKVPNLLLPGRHVCRRCDGEGQVLTWAGKLAERIAARFEPDEGEF